MMAGLGLLGTAAVALAAEEKEAGGQKPVKVVDPETNPEVIAGVKAVLAQHDKAFAAQDLEGGWPRIIRDRTPC